MYYVRCIEAMPIDPRNTPLLVWASDAARRDKWPRRLYVIPLIFFHFSAVNFKNTWIPFICYLYTLISFILWNVVTHPVRNTHKNGRFTTVAWYYEQQPYSGILCAPIRPRISTAEAIGKTIFSWNGGSVQGREYDDRILLGLSSHAPGLYPARDWSGEGTGGTHCTTTQQSRLHTQWWSRRLGYQ